MTSDRLREELNEKHGAIELNGDEHKERLERLQEEVAGILKERK